MMCLFRVKVSGLFITNTINLVSFFSFPPFTSFIIAFSVSLSPTQILFSFFKTLSTSAEMLLDPLFFVLAGYSERALLVGLGPPLGSTMTSLVARWCKKETRWVCTRSFEGRLGTDSAYVKKGDIRANFAILYTFAFA